MSTQQTEFIARSYRVNAANNSMNAILTAQTIQNLRLPDDTHLHVVRVPSTSGQKNNVEPGLYIDLTTTETNHQRCRFALNAIGFQLEPISSKSMPEANAMAITPGRFAH